MGFEEDSNFIKNLKRFLASNQVSDWILATILVIAFLLESGIIYVLAKNPPFMGSIPGDRNPLIVQPNPSLGSQVVTETFVVLLVIFLGSLGLYLIKTATSYVDERDKGVLVQFIGIFLFTGNLLLLWLILNLKTTNQFPNFSF